MRLTDEQLEGMDMWDDDREVMLAKEHQAVGSVLVKAAVAEIREHRAAMAKLLALRDSWLPHVGREWLGDAFIDDLNKLIEGE